MIKVSYELYKALEESKKVYDYDIDKILSGHYIPWDEEYMAPLNKLSHIELAKLLIDGYELEKLEYTKNTIPKHFKCNFQGGNYDYTADRHKEEFILMWLDEFNNLCGVTYEIDDIVNWVNDGRITITKVIKED